MDNRTSLAGLFQVTFPIPCLQANRSASILSLFLLITPARRGIEMSSPRTYSLPRNSYSGTVAGVRIAYNAATIASLEGIENDGLKRAMEDMAVHAALERGFTSVSIRYDLLTSTSHVE